MWHGVCEYDNNFVAAHSRLVVGQCALEEWRSVGVEGWRSGGVEEWRSGGVEVWRSGESQRRTSAIDSSCQTEPAILCSVGLSCRLVRFYPEPGPPPGTEPSSRRTTLRISAQKLDTIPCLLGMHSSKLSISTANAGDVTAGSSSCNCDSRRQHIVKLDDPSDDKSQPQQRHHENRNQSDSVLCYVPNPCHIARKPLEMGKLRPFARTSF
ncbi:hypothetical protein BV898_00740 [Hypsibius exemplaris]|uniref:Uncharacterized protein n=1 Tax=Hypsibius exemplaris TaxID=2072580 RepID=A0A1W0XEE3_HYPEX|nr:hypothetical protein BV898_00740 [Hypsibius exemplaris]